MNPAYPGLAAVALYTLGSFLQMRNFRARRPSTPSSLLLIAGPAVLLHGVTAYLLVAVTGGFDLGLYSISCLITFVLGAVVFVASLKQPLHNLFLFVFPMCVLGILGGVSLQSTSTPRALPTELLVHVLLSVAAHTVLLLAACQSLVLRAQENALREKRDMALLRLLPPLQTMERLLFQWLLAGVILLTAAIGTGFVFLDNMFEQRVVHHTVLAIASWVAFSVLLIGRARFGWRGATATRWTLLGFSLLLLAYLGSKFVMEILLT